MELHSELKLETLVPARWIHLWSGENCCEHPSLTTFTSGITLTGALRHVAGPGPVDCTVSRQQAGRIVALSARVGNGSGEGQPVMDQDLGVSWGSRVSTGDHCKQGQQQQQEHQQLFTHLDFK